MTNGGYIDLRRLAYSRDILCSNLNPKNDWHKNNSVLDGIRVNEKNIPDVFFAFERALERLSIPMHYARCYIHPSSDIQASCTTINEENCIIRLSSGLIERFSKEEVGFVIGHELGHFLLGHLSFDRSKWTIEAAFLSRNREISCDRMGLVACDNSEASLRAMMKTVSGLGDSILRFDLSAFVETGMEDFQKSDRELLLHSSHPPIVFRTRALLMFDEYLRVNGQISSKELENLNRKVEKDFDKYVDSHFFRIREDQEKEFKFWVLLNSGTRDGKLMRNYQELLISLLGSGFSHKVFSHLQGLNQVEASEWVVQQLKICRRRFSEQFPDHFLKVADELELLLRKLNSGSGSL